MPEEIGTDRGERAGETIRRVFLSFDWILSRKGVLLGLYANGRVGNLIEQPVAARVEHLLMNSSKVHPQIRQEFESAYGVWWQNVESSRGGYASAPLERAQLTILRVSDDPPGAGDTLPRSPFGIICHRAGAGRYQWCPTSVTSPCRQAGKSLISWRTAVGTVTSTASSAATSIEARRARPERESCAAARIAGAA